MEISKSLEGLFLDFPVHHSRRRRKKTVGKAIDQEFEWSFKQLLCLIRGTKMLLFVLKKIETPPLLSALGR